MAVAGCKESVELLQLSDHQLVSRAGVASWNVLEMHHDAWMHYANALTWPSKQDAELLRRFLTVALVLPAAAAVHDRAVLTEIHRCMDQSDQVSYTPPYASASPYINPLLVLFY